ALAAQPADNLWPIATLLGLLGALIGAYFLLTYDWRGLPTDFALLDRIGIWWMALRPALPGFLHPNTAGGLLALLIPFPLAAGIHAWRGQLGRQRALILLNCLCGGLALIALIMTSSRGAWGALAVGL